MVEWVDEELTVEEVALLTVLLTENCDVFTLLLLRLGHANHAPFGLTNMLASFQWDMDVVLSGLNWLLTLVYINDIIVFSRTFEDHLGHLQEVFQQLWAANMYMKPSKCNFCQHELLFLGHIMHKDSIMANPEKLHAIQVMTRPANIVEVHVFLGLCNYYCWFMLDFAQLVDTLYCLTSRSVEQHFMWVGVQSAEEAAYVTPVLVFPNFEQPFYLHMDASQLAIGAVLLQCLNNGAEQVIAYTSHWLLGSK
ncbi:uncharacterized protein ACA1_304830 [Acanthamoeba castellanii str. Neff]|uniref:Reverse transcriptase/retrotransposon-derived protein RNase H-like domain-containing protein n=1 Tax=Acanthamoeba castellanii (strain ATCC 30010 / Neff) TaxID=1257118 RepID=L8HF71_ACACF|nr:uncharacterized protein ACA1_304830 [Acanthamoeba castellanii str. Neff]ELR23820.1 hypothetical protein ACA1_304830 [Acanthamoeba castellanii str. Neff]